MSAFIVQQTDYLFFLHGLGFILLGGVCFYLARLDKTSLAWDWLGAFGVLQGVNKWLSLAALGLGDDPIGQWMRLIALAISFLCLCEFGRRATVAQPPQTDWRWTYALLIVGTVSGGVWGIDGLAATTNYVLGLCGGLWTGLALLLGAKVADYTGRRLLKAVASSFIVFGIVTGLIVPPAPFFPAAQVNQATFMQLFGLPAQVLQQLLLALTIICLWSYLLSRRKAVVARSTARRHSPYINVLAISVVVLVITGWITTNAVGQHEARTVPEYFLAHARGVSTIDSLLQHWQQSIAAHRLVVMSITGLIVFILAGALLSVQSFQDSNARMMASEAELRRAKEAAEAATQAKSDFLANMSHEIRTPITAVLGYSDLLLEPGLTPAEQESYLRTIRRNGQVLLELIDDILDISKIEAGKLEVERIACSPWQVLADLGAIMRVRADAKGLELCIGCEGLLPNCIFTDPTRLRQILVNLVGNAVKFTAAGSVQVVARLLPGEGQERYMQFDVIDTGIGMTPAQLAMVFQPFIQAESATNRKYGGTGLGLTISKRLANLLGGDITVKSVPDRGSTFSLTVAVGSLHGVGMSHYSQAMLGGVAAAVATTNPRPRLNCHVLLAEDGPDNQRLLSVILRNAGAEVTIAQNGKEAFEKAMATFPGWGKRYSDPKTPIDIILMDIQMPIIDGYEATRRLRQEGYTGPIIALSAHATNVAAEKCLEAGCNDYLSKPIDRDALLRKIAKYVGTTVGSKANCELANGRAVEQAPLPLENQ